mgnify:CR=1 FL=1
MTNEEILRQELSSVEYDYYNSRCDDEKSELYEELERISNELGEEY